MKNKMGLMIGALIVMLVITGVVVYKAVSKPKTPAVTATTEESNSGVLPPVDASVVVSLDKSPTKANSVVITAKGLGGKMVTVGYELTYESQGLIKGVNSGSTPIDTKGKDVFEREVYLGTCSRNDCKPDVGVTKVSVALEFTDASGKKSQFSKDYDLNPSAGTGSSSGSAVAIPPED